MKQFPPNMSEAPKNQITIDEVISTIDSRIENEQVKMWLNKEVNQIVQIINTYAADPDTYQLNQDLRENPLLILSTILQSAETLYTYQQEYNQALIKLAEANGIDYSELGEIPSKLQLLTVEREKQNLANHLSSGGRVVIALNGIGASGKGTVSKKAGAVRAVNYTTRQMRPSESHGETGDYYYINQLEGFPEGSIDKDTGFHIVGVDPISQEPIFELDSNGQPINYLDKYGPFVTTLWRPGRAVYGTTVDEFQRLRDAGKKTIFFEHGPEQVIEAGRELPKHFPDSKVLPVCILAPSTGIIQLASRIVVRTYGDPVHRDPQVVDGYKITDSYLESTIGFAQINELAMTTEFMQGETPLGVAYIVNDNLEEAVKTFKGLINPN